MLETFIIVNCIVWTIVGLIAIFSKPQPMPVQPLEIKISIQTRTVYPNEPQYPEVKEVTTWNS